MTGLILIVGSLFCLSWAIYLLAGKRRRRCVDLTFHVRTLPRCHECGRPIRGVDYVRLNGETVHTRCL